MHDTKTEETNFKMKVLRSFRTPLERQIGESLEIERRGWTADILLNRKEEYNRIRMPRERVESVDDKENEDNLENHKEISNQTFGVDRKINEFFHAKGP